MTSSPEPNGSLTPADETVADTWFARQHQDTGTDLASGHEDRRTLQRYPKPSKEGTARRLTEVEIQRGTWTPSAEEFPARMATH